MRGWWRWTVVPGMLASVARATPLTAQAASAAGSDVCSLATNEEFQKAHGINAVIGILPDTRQATEMVWGPHCDYSGGSIDLFIKKSPSAELAARVPTAHGGKQAIAAGTGWAIGQTTDRWKIRRRNDIRAQGPGVEALRAWGAIPS